MRTKRPYVRRRPVPIPGTASLALECPDSLSYLALCELAHERLRPLTRHFHEDALCDMVISQVWPYPSRAVFYSIRVCLTLRTMKFVVTRYTMVEFGAAFDQVFAAIAEMLRMHSEEARLTISRRRLFRNYFSVARSDVV